MYQINWLQACLPQKLGKMLIENVTWVQKNRHRRVCSRQDFGISFVSSDPHVFLLKILASNIDCFHVFFALINGKLAILAAEARDRVVSASSRQK